MKKFLIIAITLLAAVTGCKKYEFNTDFTMPSELVSPSTVTLDVTSSATVVLSWIGGGAADGGIVLYNVLFDMEGGDFSKPVAVMPSDLGAKNTLTLTHAQINTLARKAGVKPNSTGSFIWTVRGAKGGETKTTDQVGTLRVIRGEGIDNIPEQLFILGTAAKEAGQEFRCVEEGLFVIYTRVAAGKIQLNSVQDGSGFSYSADANAKLEEGDKGYELSKVPQSGIARITVNFNTLNIKVEEISSTIEAVLEIEQHDDGNFAVLEYAGNGIWQGEGDVVLSTQSWGLEERYCFRVYVDGEIMRWGSDNGGVLPDGTEKFWYVDEYAWEWWNNVWKLDHSFHEQTVVFTINTNNNGVWNHSVELSTAEPVAPSSTPAELYLNGDAGEEDNMAFRKEGDKFVLYTRLKAGKIKLSDDQGGKYYIDADKKLFVGSKAYTVEASEGVSRITVDFSAKAATIEQVGTEVYTENAWDKIVMATLTYQGFGKWAGEGEIKFANSGDERFSFRTTVDGKNVRWGSNRGNDGIAPDGTEEFWYIYESEWDGHQWDNLFKFNKEDEGKIATFVIDGNNPVHMTHSVTVNSSDPEPPSIAPADLALSGTAAETEGQAFRKESEGVFVIYTRLKAGKLSFKSGSKNYFASEGGLLQGEGQEDVAASEEGSVTRITVNFQNNTVTTNIINEYAHLKFAATYRDVAHLKYSGNGIWSESNAHITFVNQEEASFVSWGWEERYYFIIEVDGTELQWGMKTGAVNNDLKFNGDDSFWQIEENPWNQWDHCWKFDASLNGANADISINTNDNGVWRHTITKK